MFMIKDCLIKPFKSYHFAIAFLLAYFVVYYTVYMVVNVYKFFPDYDVFAIWTIVWDVLIVLGSALVFCRKMAGVYVLAIVLVANIIVDLSMKEIPNLWIYLFTSVKLPLLFLLGLLFLKKDGKSAWQVLKERHNQ